MKKSQYGVVLVKFEPSKHNGGYSLKESKGWWPLNPKKAMENDYFVVVETGTQRILDIQKFGSGDVTFNIPEKATDKVKVEFNNLHSPMNDQIARQMASVGSIEKAKKLGPRGSGYFVFDADKNDFFKRSEIAN